jgi:anhydro-N-acetylmuramic acid kinase
MRTIKVIGLMSGTSLDGLDIALCEFSDSAPYNYKIVSAETIPYNDSWKNILTSVENGSAMDLVLSNSLYGEYLGEMVIGFLSRLNQTVDFISSHGHTIFHQPNKKLTFQLGSGASIAAVTGLPVVCDFRSLDVALGGQGAPLVPMGDKLLFNDYQSCLNIGGFANISFDNEGNRIAYDICPANIVLNQLIKEYDPTMEYDRDGIIASKGKIDHVLLTRINSIGYYSSIPPKSLGKEWVLENIFPLLKSSDLVIEDKISTFTEHIAHQVNLQIKKFGISSILVTGGGAFNVFLVERLNALTDAKTILPEKEIIEYKEALIFAFLGLLRMKNSVNTLSSVTGAVRDITGGTIYWP